jgi:sporulation protein YlmC with PRC-barrel domain
MQRQRLNFGSFTIEVVNMTETPMGEPGTYEPLILERLSDLEDESEYLEHYPDIRGMAVINPTGDEVGVVDDLYVNPRNRQVEMAAITFMGATGGEGKRVLVPVEEIELVNGKKVRILTHEEKIRLAPEFREGPPIYETYYEFWGTRLAGPTEEPAQGYIRPPGRLVLEGEEAIEEEESEE